MKLLVRNLVTMNYGLVTTKLLVRNLVTMKIQRILTPIKNKKNVKKMKSINVVGTLQGQHRSRECKRSNLALDYAVSPPPKNTVGLL
mgnify:CR=1 FL=1